MLNRERIKLSKYKQILMIILVVLITGINPSLAGVKNISAGYVLNEMNNDQRISYISGVIEGLAYSRFLREKPNENGMNCIYDWFFKDSDKKMKKITAWFNRHLDKPVGVLLYVLIKKECGV
ncbi:MAG: hypothetical protein HRU28_07525 [Rhizobiales bacterium]|nr:hypothetical protein [Hyphomicrobiales bacterium]